MVLNDSTGQPLADTLDKDPGQYQQPPGDCQEQADSILLEKTATFILDLRI